MYWHRDRGRVKDMIQMRGDREEKSKSWQESDKEVENSVGSSLLVSVQSYSFCYQSLSCSTRNSNSSVLSADWLGTMLEACVNALHTDQRAILPYAVLIVLFLFLFFRSQCTSRIMASFLIQRSSVFFLYYRSQNVWQLLFIPVKIISLNTKHHTQLKSTLASV